MNPLHTQPIVLNVRGERFITTYTTLTNEEDTYFCDLFDENLVSLKSLPDGSYFIDRDAFSFAIILRYLGEEDIGPTLGLLTSEQKNVLRREIDFYRIKSLEIEEEYESGICSRLCEAATVCLLDTFC
jgi:hypothetical protein